MEQYIGISSATESVSAIDLGSKFSESPQIQHDQQKNTYIHDLSKQEYIFDDDEEEDDDGYDLTDAILAQNGYAKSEPVKHNNVGNQECIYKEDEDEDEDEEEDLTAAILAQSGYAKHGPPLHSPMTWPSDKKLVSAFKGSREKEGMLDTKMRVMWAPDVYDPPPSADDHFLQNKTDRQMSESKKPKNKQKWGGKSGGEGEGKDMKQVQKYGGSSNNCFNKLEDNERLVSSPRTASDHLVKTKTGRPNKRESKSVGEGKGKSKGKDKKQILGGGKGKRQEANSEAQYIG